MEIAPWVLPVFGSVLLSDAYTSAGVAAVVTAQGIVAVLLIFLGTVPLGIRAWHEKTIRLVQENVERRQRACMELVAEFVPKIPVTNVVSRAGRMELSEQVTDAVVTSLAQEIFADAAEVRAIFYAYGTTNGEPSLSPTAWCGRADAPRIHRLGEDKYEEMIELLTTGQGIQQRSVSAGQSYRSFLSVSVFSGTRGYGILTVDSVDPHGITDADVTGVKMLAHLIAAFCDAAERGKRANG